MQCRKRIYTFGIDLIVGLPNSKIIDFDNDIKIVREFRHQEYFYIFLQIRRKIVFL